MRKYLTILRIPHWTKNVFVFVAMIFGGKLAGTVNEVLAALGSTVAAFVCFCLASSAVYILNDLIDRESDRLHPEKRQRPIAAGAVAPSAAVWVSIICAAVALSGAVLLNRGFAVIIAGYVLLMVLYSVSFKKKMILDCMVISVGFCLRAVAGAVVVGVAISPWLIICTFALCLFLSFGKRRSEIEQLGDDRGDFRKTLAGYSPELLAHMVNVTSGVAIVCFLLYTMDDRTREAFGTNNLVYTTPMVLYCIFRFSALIQKGKYSGPVRLILSDRPFQVGFVCWALACVLIIYANKLGINLSGWIPGPGP